MAHRHCKSSGLKTGDEAIATVPAQLCGVVILTNGTDAATLILYDNASSGTGTVLFKGIVAGSQNSIAYDFTVPIAAQSGIYADVSGTGANFIVFFY